MPNIQIKSVPDDVHATLRARAAASGQSLQDYLLAQLTEQARRPLLREVLARIETRRGGSFTADDVVSIIRADRGRP